MKIYKLRKILLIGLSLIIVLIIKDYFRYLIRFVSAKFELLFDKQNYKIYSERLPFDDNYS
jgi:hypothetical protein